MTENPRNDARQLRQLDFDLANYFSNTIIPQLFVDADLILRIFTPPAMKHFSLTYHHVGRNISDIKDNLRYPSVVADIQEIIDNPDRILEKEVQTTDGRWFQMNIVPYIEYEEGVVNGVIITFVDITKRLLALKELERLNSQHETLMYALSHDLRQPITSIKLIAEGLQMAYLNKDHGQFEEWIQNLKDSSRNMEIVVEDFTSNRTKEKGRSPGDMMLNIQDICEDIITALQVEIKEKKIKVETDIQATELIFPKTSLRSVIYNLIHNAVKFSDPEKPSEIKIVTEAIEDYVILCVQDNGLGIPPEDQRRVFKKSSRLSKNIEGTGMGLYVVKKLIEDYNGRIKLESKEKEGTTFKIFFKKDPVI